jgi:hypothetical protein
MVWLVQKNVCNSSNPQSLGGVLPPDPLLGLFPGFAGDLNRYPDPSPTHASLISNPGSAPDKWVRMKIFGILNDFRIFFIGKGSFNPTIGNVRRIPTLKL